SLRLLRSFPTRRSSDLAPHLVYGYDFTRNTDGGSEMADVTQSTVGVVDGQSATLNQSSEGTVQQSTVGVVDQSGFSAFGHGTMRSEEHTSELQSRGHLV